MNKSLILSFLFLATALVSFSHENPSDSTKKNIINKKNIIALDATALLSQFFRSNTTGNFYSNYPYMISYRRFISKSNAIRFSIGGNINSTESTEKDSLKKYAKRNDYTVALGFEHYNYLGKRWMYYFGADIVGYSRNYYDKQYSTKTAYRESGTVNSGYGISPFIGITFNITRTISIATETGYSVNYVTIISKSKSVPWSPWDTKTVTKGIETSFYPPTNLIFRFKF